MNSNPPTKNALFCIFIFTLIVCLILIIWLINFIIRYYAPLHYGGHSTYKSVEIKMRRSIYLIFSYFLMLPWLIEQVWATFILYSSERDASWTYSGESAVSLHESSTDLKLHFAFWLCFWCFVHIKLFRLWMIRYDFEYDKEMRNIEWKINLGLRSIKRRSIIIRYRNILGSKILMITFHSMMVLINSFLQIFVRLLPILQEMRYSQYYEQSIALSLLIIELSLFIIVMHKEPMRAINDVQFVRSEWLLFAKMCTALLSLYLICLAIWFTTDIYMNPILVQCGAQSLFNITLFSFGFLDFVWIIRQVNKTMPHKAAKSNARLVDILECQDGFEAMMRFLVGEYLCQNLLSYVECSQFVNKWSLAQAPESAYCDKNLYLPLIWGFIRQQSDAFRVFMPDDITLLVLSYYKKLYVPLEVRRSMPQKFLFFEPLTFDTDAKHYRYLIQKYITETASLKVLLSDKLRHKMMQMPYNEPNTVTRKLIDVVNCAREELWQVVSHAFEKFETTRDFTILAKEMEPEQHIIYKDVDYFVHLTPIPKVTDAECESTESVVIEMGAV